MFILFYLRLVVHITSTNRIVIISAENHSRNRRRRIRHTTTTVLLKWQVSILFWPHHCRRTYSRFLSEKQSFTKHTLGKVKTHITKIGTKSQIQKMQSTKFMQWNIKLKAMLPIKRIITKQLKRARLDTSTNSNWWL